MLQRPSILVTERPRAVTMAEASQALHKKLQAMREKYGEPVTEKEEKFLCDPGCPICAGSGFVRDDLPVDHPEFGKIRLCPNRAIKDVSGHGLTDSDIKLSFDNILDIDQALNAAAIVKSALEAGFGYIYIWGGFGKGKTRILKTAIATALGGGDPRAAYAETWAILDHIRQGFSADKPDDDSVSRLNWWLSMHVLAIDELDKINVTSWVQERLFAVFNQRYVMCVRQEALTVMAGNGPPNQLPPYLADRLADGRSKIIHLPGKSIRPAMDESEVF